jgi:uncharacterized protein YebE (UPF0316 family)
MDQTLLITGLLVFVARVLDVGIGTIRTIITVQGRMVTAFFLGIIEITLWITVAGTVIHQIKDSPVLVLFYALGFATGNVVGILAERKLAFGPIILKVITNRKADELTEAFRQLYLNVTRFHGEGVRGPVTELYAVCHRRDLKTIIPAIRRIDANAFYVTEQARDVSKILRPVHTPLTGWRAILKKK